MDYRVEISPGAFADIDEIVERIGEDSARNASRWEARLFAKLSRLGTIPRACSLAPEGERCSYEVRQTFFGDYRILFTVRDAEELVYVLTVRHGARRFLSGGELERMDS